MQPGLSKLLLNINFVEGRPSLVSDLNIVAAILVVGKPLANDVETYILLFFYSRITCSACASAPYRYDGSPYSLVGVQCIVSHF